MSGSPKKVPKLGAEIAFLVPTNFRTLPCPTYPEIRLALVTPGAPSRALSTRPRPTLFLIATEGTDRAHDERYCRKMKRPFTTSCHALP
ncbi:MAG: hypothetical protein R3D30_14095 [Hyphomicrobiales bacterium]